MYKKSTSSHTSFLRCCHNFGNLLFRMFWVSLNMPFKFNKINLWEILMFICMRKINFVPPFFLDTLQRYWKLVILATLAMTDYGWYQLVENFEAYRRPKDKFFPHLFLKIILIYCRLVILGTLGTSVHKKNWCWSKSKITSFLRYYIKNPAIWLAKSILTHNLRTRIFDR